MKGKATGYLIGSSTMGSILGPMLKGMIKRRWGVDARHWGKASSGLARPDFHDWPKAAKGLIRRYKPDFVVVSLGTNDNQALRMEKSWVRPKRSKEWEAIYAERVRDMLAVLSAGRKDRAIIWMGPTAFEGRTANVLGPKIHKIMKREVEAFEGNAIYVDVYSATRHANGKLVRRFQAPDRKSPERARGSDGIHLTARAVQHLMAEPSLEPLAPCFDAQVARWQAEEVRRETARRKKAEARRVEKDRLRAERKAERQEAKERKQAEKLAATEARAEARAEARERRRAKREAKKQKRLEARAKKLAEREAEPETDEEAATDGAREEETDSPDEAYEASKKHGAQPKAQPEQSERPETGEEAAVGGGGSATAEAEHQE
jgi:hypothetical protein